MKKLLEKKAICEDGQKSLGSLVISSFQGIFIISKRLIQKLLYRLVSYMLVYLKSILPILVLLVASMTASGLDLAPIIPLTISEQKALRQLVGADTAAQRAFGAIRIRANQALNDSPQPADSIFYEGLHDSDPNRKDTKARLEDMNKIHALSYAYVVTLEKKYANKALAFILAWANSYLPTGNPINENKLTPLLVAYDYIKPAISRSDKQKIESWITRLGIASMNAGFKGEVGNWRSKRIKIVALAGTITGNDDLLAFSKEAVDDYIEENFFGDSTTVDLRHRDALSYHCGGIKPFLSVMLILEKDYPNLYIKENSDGGSVQKSVSLVLPYAKGEKEYPQWVKSQVDFDRERWEDGNAYFRPGRIWEPQSGLELFAYAQFFDPRFAQVVQLLSGSDNQKYPSWESVLAAVKRMAN